MIKVPDFFILFLSEICVLKALATLFLFFAALQLTYAQKTFQLQNNTAYIAEVFFTNSEKRKQAIETLGLIVNSTTANYKNHFIRAELMLSYGGEPSANFVRDLQTFSNIEAGFLYGFYQLYYQYVKNDFWIKFGQQDINSDFAIPDNGLLFAHSSFGIDPVITLNLPAPTYPVSALSLSSQYRFSPVLSLKIGIFDGQFEPPKKNLLGIGASLDRDDGLLYVAEGQINLNRDRFASKFGLIHHSGQFYNYHKQDTTRGLWSFYQINDFTFLRKNEKYIGAFTQLNFSTHEVSLLKYYIGLGFTGRGLLWSASKNEVGLAAGFAKVNSGYAQIAEEFNATFEGVIEANFKHRATNWLDIQYYLQYLGKREIGPLEQNPMIVALRLYFDIESIKP